MRYTRIGTDKIEPPAPVTGNVYTMSARERSRFKIKSLPANLGEAINQLEKSPLMKEALGEHVFQQFIEAKRTEWSEYIAQVHDWELDRYLSNL